MVAFIIEHISFKLISNLPDLISQYVQILNLERKWKCGVTKIVAVIKMLLRLQKANELYNL